MLVGFYCSTVFSSDYTCSNASVECGYKGLRRRVSNHYADIRPLLSVTINMTKPNEYADIAKFIDVGLQVEIAHQSAPTIDVAYNPLQLPVEEPVSNSCRSCRLDAVLWNWHY